MTIVCLGPVLNTLFDYFVLNTKPSIVSIITIVITTAIYFIYVYYSLRSKK